jgi:hypothetical protein
MRVIFVRRGQNATYNVLIERCQLIDDVDVRWDRRTGDDRRLESRPVAAERRRDERRKLPESRNSKLREYTVVDISS